MRIPPVEVDKYFVMEDAMGTAQLEFELATTTLEDLFPWLKDLDPVQKTDVLVSLNTRIPLRVLMSRCNSGETRDADEKGGEGTGGFTYCAQRLPYP